MLSSLFSLHEHSPNPNYISAEFLDNQLWSNYGVHNELQPQNPQTSMEIDDPNFDVIIANNTLNIQRSQLTTEISDFFLPKDNHIPTQPEVKPDNKNGNELSTEEVMRIAAAHFIQLSTPKHGDPSMLRLPFGISLSSLSTDNIKNVELASFLLAAAEKVSSQQYERASNLLRQCYSLSSVSGNPVQRVVYYFCDALQERIDRETGKLSFKAYNSMTPEKVIKAMLSSHPLQLICHKTLPFGQVLRFTSVQAIIDNVATAKRIHVIDLSLKHGLEWTILMQALATRTLLVETLKLSAVAVAEEVVAESGKRLKSFAEDLGLAFEFKIVIVPDMKEMKEEMFELKEGEVVALYSAMDMNSMIVKPESLENLMRVIWKIRPRVMTVTDCEAKHNSPSFVNRFTEALFYFSAMFDCIDGAMGKGDENRLALEADFMAQGIKNIVAMEGSERVVRHVGIGVWREFFARFGLVEADLNEYSMYQGSLILKQFVNGSSCSLEKDGKSLLIGWKGTPMLFVSAFLYIMEKLKLKLHPPKFLIQDKIFSLFLPPTFLSTKSRYCQTFPPHPPATLLFLFHLKLHHYRLKDYQT